VTKVLSGYHVCVVYIMKVTSMAHRETNFMCNFSVLKWGGAGSLGRADPNVPIVRSSFDRCTCSICGIVGRGRPKCSERSTHRCYFVQHKYSTDYHGTEPGSPLQQFGE